MTGNTVLVLNLGTLDWERRLAAAALQGLANRDGPRLFLDYSNYDDPGTRRTNSVMMTEEDWFSRFRGPLERNDAENLEWYRSAYGLAVEELPSLDEAVRRFADRLEGFVIWDPELPDSANAALTLAGLEDLLVLTPSLAAWGRGFGLECRHDLRGRFKDRAGLYAWAAASLLPRCAKGKVASSEPGWKRPEFSDYIVKERLFAFGLSSFEKGGLRSLGGKILLLLVAGPRRLRDFLFSLRLDAALRRLALSFLALGSRETGLMIRILRKVEALPYPTLFGWHVERDDELSFMMLVSACGLRLVPSFMAANYSFHSALPAKTPLRQRHVPPAESRPEEGLVYLSFTLSDGGQLALMNTAELGGFRRPERGVIPFNWEIQPLLAEIAPALLGCYYERLTPNDHLVAGPSGAGYVIPPLVPDLQAYFRESAKVCAKADISVVTSYNGDPPGRVLRDHRNAEGFAGFSAGYFHLGEVRAWRLGEKAFVANAWPPVDKIGASREETLEGIRALVEAEGPLPRFVGCHLFAYRTNVADVAAFVATLDPAKVRVVRSDELLNLAGEWMRLAGKTELDLAGKPR